MTTTVVPFLLGAGGLVLVPGHPPAATRLCPPATAGARGEPGNRAARGWLLAGSSAVMGLAIVVVPGWPAPWWRVAVAALVTAAVPVVAPRLIRNGGSRRETRQPLRLAATWDLLAACLRSGMPVPSAVRAVAVDVPGAGAAALMRTADLIALGRDPVDAWRPALDCPDTVALARAARRSARSGAAMAAAVANLAGELRDAASDAAEARAQRAGVLVSGPLGLCFLPAFLCLGVVPVVIGLAQGMLSNGVIGV